MIKKHALFAYFIFNIFSVHSVLFASEKTLTPLEINTDTTPQYLTLHDSPKKFNEALQKNNLEEFARKTGLICKIHGDITLQALMSKVKTSSSMHAMQRENQGQAKESDATIQAREERLLRIILQNDHAALGQIATRKTTPWATRRDQAPTSPTLTKKDFSQLDN